MSLAMFKVAPKYGETINIKADMRQDANAQMTSDASRGLSSETRDQGQNTSGTDGCSRD
jgi:hypothetical protein